MTEPTEAEVEAARIALSKLCADGCEAEGDTRSCSDPPCPCAKFARAALTAAAQVRARADDPVMMAQGEAYVAAVYAMNRYRHAFHGRPVRDLTEAEVAWRTAHEKLDKLVCINGLMPIYGATEDQGPEVLGLRKGEE